MDGQGMGTTKLIDGETKRGNRTDTKTRDTMIGTKNVTDAMGGNTCMDVMSSTIMGDTSDREDGGNTCTDVMSSTIMGDTSDRKNGSSTKDVTDTMGGNTYMNAMSSTIMGGTSDRKNGSSTKGNTIEGTTGVMNSTYVDDSSTKDVTDAMGGSKGNTIEGATGVMSSTYMDDSSSEGISAEGARTAMGAHEARQREISRTNKTGMSRRGTEADRSRTGTDRRETETDRSRTGMSRRGTGTDRNGA